MPREAGRAADWHGRTRPRRGCRWRCGTSRVPAVRGRGQPRSGIWYRSSARGRYRERLPCTRTHSAHSARGGEQLPTGSRVLGLEASEPFASCQSSWEKNHEAVPRKMFVKDTLKE